MMVQKALLFGDEEAAEAILLAPQPGDAKDLGRNVRRFCQDTWDAKSFEIVVQGNLEKFIQNNALGQYLLSTKNRVLVEASPKDRIWGIGMSKEAEGIEQPVRWRGRNLLGFALMEARARMSQKFDSVTIL